MTEDYKRMMEEDLEEMKEMEELEMLEEDEDENKAVVPTSISVDGISAKQANADKEYNLVESLLKAADFKNDVTPVEIKRGGEYLFTVHIRPLSDEETRVARKKSVKMYTNPNGKRLPKVEGELNSNLFNSWMIYLATTEEDKKKIWGNEAVMSKYDILQPIDTIDKLLTFGEKLKLSDLVAEISGIEDEDEMSEEEYAKN